MKKIPAAPSKKASAPAFPERPQWFSSLSLDAQIAAAMPAARTLLTEGIDTYSRDDDDLNERVLAIACGVTTDGELASKFVEGLAETKRVHVNELLHIARALGLAIGLLLRPETFRGGAR